MKKTLLSFLITISFCLSMQAQALLWDSLSDRRLTFLKGEKHMNVEYVYDGVLINGKQEADFLESQKDNLNEKDAKKGESFVTHWQTSKTAKYPKNFEHAFRSMARKNMRIAQGTKEKYTLVVKLVKVKTGEASFGNKAPSYADFEISFVEAASGKVLAKARIINVKGIVKAKSNIGPQGSVMRVVARSVNIDVANRIAQCYESAAFATAKYVIRYNKKKKK